MKNKIILSSFLALLILMIGNVVYGATKTYETDRVTFELPDTFLESSRTIVDDDDYERIIYENSNYGDSFEYTIYGRYGKSAYTQSYLESETERLLALYNEGTEVIEQTLIEINGMEGMHITFKYIYTPFGSSYSLSITHYYDYYFLLTDNYQLTLYFSSSREGFVNEDEEHAIVNSFYVADSIIESHGIPYTDVSSDSWAYDAIKYVYDEGIMLGYGGSTKFGTKFGFSNAITRGQLAVILYRMEGEPTVTTSSKFSDVQNSGAYYYKAVIWANKNGIVTGYGTTGLFKPTQSITRQELALMLYRYAGYKGKDTTASGSLSSFADSSSVSEWAEDAVKWAVGKGIISGITSSDGKIVNISPTGNATRAQSATMIMRFCEL